MHNRVEVAFEGPDAGGKSTQSRALKEYYEQKGHKVALLTSPSRSLVGRVIRNNLDTLNEMGLDGARFFKQDILRSYRAVPDDASIVLWDRHIYSIYAANRIANMDYIRAIRPVVSEPQIVFYMDVEPELSLARGLAITDHHLSLEQLRAKQARYFELLATENGRFRKIDVSASVDTVFQSLVAIIDQELVTKNSKYSLSQ